MDRDREPAEVLHNIKATNIQSPGPGSGGVTGTYVSLCLQAFAMHLTVKVLHNIKVSNMYSPGPGSSPRAALVNLLIHFKTDIN